MRFLLVILLSLISFVQPQATTSCNSTSFYDLNNDLCQCDVFNSDLGDIYPKTICQEHGYTQCNPSAKAYDGHQNYYAKCECPDGTTIDVVPDQLDKSSPCPQTTCPDGTSVFTGESCPCPDGGNTYNTATQSSKDCPQLCPDGKTTYTGSESTCPKTMCPDGKSSYYVGTQNDCPQTQCSNGTKVYNGETCPCPDGKSTYVAGAQSLSQCPAYCSSGKETNGFCVADTGQCFTMASASNDWTQQPDPSCTGCGYYPASTYCVSCSDGTLVLKGEQCPCPDGKTTYAAGTQTEANCPAFCLPGSSAQSDFCVSTQSNSQGECLTKASYASQWQQSAYEEGDCATCGYYPSSTYCVTCYDKSIVVKGKDCSCPANIVRNDNNSVYNTANQSLSDCPDYCDAGQTQPTGQSLCYTTGTNECYQLIKGDKSPDTQGGLFYGGTDKEHPCYPCGYYGNCANNK